MVKLVDTLDLGSSALRCAGSSPVPGIPAASAAVLTPTPNLALNLRIVRWTERDFAIGTINFSSLSCDMAFGKNETKRPRYWQFKCARWLFSLVALSLLLLMAYRFAESRVLPEERSSLEALYQDFLEDSGLIDA